MSIKSKAIRKAKEIKKTNNQVIYNLTAGEKKLILISSQKYLTLNSDDNGVGCNLSTDFKRSYLKGSRAEHEVKSLLKRCSVIQKRVSPIDSDLVDSKISFEHQL